jgi:hypothetical protein
MSAAKKFKDYYPTEKELAVEEITQKTQNIEDKRQIEAHLKNISKLLEDDPEMQKKAALIISQLINSSK